MIRRRRALASIVAMIAFVFAQIVVSAHACDGPSPGFAGEVVAHMEGCPEAGQEPGPCQNVCEQHCQYGHASVAGNPPAPMAMDVPGPLFRIAIVEATSGAGSGAPRRVVPAIAAPPPAILFGVLRI
jgi:hypothetical protein